MVAAVVVSGGGLLFGFGGGVGSCVRGDVGGGGGGGSGAGDGGGRG